MPTRPNETIASATRQVRQALAIRDAEIDSALRALEALVARVGAAPAVGNVTGFAPAALGAVDAAAYLGIGRTSLLALPIPSVRIERRRLWRRADLDAYVAGLPASVPGEQIA